MIVDTQSGILYRSMWFVQITNTIFRSGIDWTQSRNRSCVYPKRKIIKIDFRFMPLRTTRMRRRDRWGGWSNSIGVWRVTEQKHRPEKEADGKKSGKEKLNISYIIVLCHQWIYHLTDLTWLPCKYITFNAKLKHIPTKSFNAFNNVIWARFRPPTKNDRERARESKCAQHMQ